MKLTKRKGFNFFRSYYDVYNLLSNEDKVAFMDALLDRQFLGVKPTELTGMSQFAYVSQTNSIDSQVKGYEDKTKTKLNPLEENNYTPTVGVNKKTLTPAVQVQVEEKEKEKEQYVIYSEIDFLENWKMCRKKFMTLPTHIKKLETFERVDFNNALKDFSKDEINTAMLGLFKQERKNITSMYLKPKHFLENISKYLNAEMSKDYGLYGKEVKQVKGGL